MFQHLQSHERDAAAAALEHGGAATVGLDLLADMRQTLGVELNPAGKTICVLHNTGRSEILIALSELSEDLNFSSVNAVIGAGADAYARLDGSQLILSPQTSVVLWPEK